MNTSFKTMLSVTVLGGAAALTLLGTASSSRAAGVVRAALVELVFPSKPISELLANGTVASGSATGVLGVTSLTLSNDNPTRTTVIIFATSVVGPTCDSPEVSGTRRVLAFVPVPAESTMHLTYPSPLVVTPTNGFSCITMNRKLGITAMFNGFIS